MGTRNLPGGKERPVRGADNLTAICEPTVYKMWKPRRLTTLWAFTACLPYVTQKFMGQNVEFSYVKVGGTYSDHWALKG
jgi:hypothetical protein